MWLPEITEENFGRYFGDYMEHYFGSKIDGYKDKCPYYMDFDDEDLQRKQIKTWLAFDATDDDGKTILEDFVESTVHDDRVAVKLLQMNHPLLDTFFINAGPDGRKRITMTAESTGKTYRVEISSGKTKNYVKNGVYVGTIHPWYEDGTYRTIGIPLILKPPNNKA